MGLYSQAIFVKSSRELFWFVVIFHLPVPSLPKFSPRYAVFFSPFIVVSVMKHVSLASSVVTVASLHVYSSLLHGEELWRPDLGPEEIEGGKNWTLDQICEKSVKYCFFAAQNHASLISCYFKVYEMVFRRLIYPSEVM